MATAFTWACVVAFSACLDFQFSVVYGAHLVIVHCGYDLPRLGGDEREVAGLYQPEPRLICQRGGLSDIRPKDR
jgi:hypothetical protein